MDTHGKSEESQNPIANVPQLGLIMTLWRKFADAFGLEGEIFWKMKQDRVSEVGIEDALAKRRELIKQLKPQFDAEAVREREKH